MTSLAWPPAPATTFVLASRKTRSPTHATGMQEPVSDIASHPAALASRDEQLAALITASAGGDARAFERFYNGTVRYALAVVRRIAGDVHAEDVLSDCYFQAWQNAGRFDPQRGSALTWLLTMARSRALDRLRQETLRHGGLSGAPRFDADAHEESGAPGPEALLDSLQACTALRAALARLSANERWVLGLAYFRDCTHAEIAAQTGLPLGTVKSLINRAQHKLRQALQPAAPVPHSPTSAAARHAESKPA